MSKNNDLKKVKIRIVLVLIILVICAVLLLIANMHGKEKVLAKVIKGIDKLNYSYLAEDGESTIKVFGKKEKKSLLDGTEEYIDYEKKQSVTVYPENQYKEEYENDGIEAMPYYQDFIDQYFMNDNYDYKYIGKEQEDSKEYIVVKFISKNIIDGRQMEMSLWLDSNSYIVSKEIIGMKTNGEEVIIDERNYNYSTNENTLNDVQVPEIIDKYNDNTNN